MAHSTQESRPNPPSCPLGAAQTVPTCDTRKSFSLFTVYYRTMNADKLAYLLLAKMLDAEAQEATRIFKC